MTEFDSPARARGDAEGSRRAAEINQDLKALRVSTTRELPTMEPIVGRTRGSSRAPAAWEERWMATIRLLKGRPWLTTAVAAAVMAVVLLVIPISYQRTAGHDVALTVAGNLGAAQVSDVARGLGAVLGVPGVRVEARPDNGAPRFAFRVSVPEKPGVNTAGLAKAYAKGLAARGIAATATATPRVERVWGTVYAYARDQVIRISVDGKSAAALEAEIRQRLAESGVADAQVSVTDEGNHGRRISVEMKHENTGTGADCTIPQLELTQDGLPAMGPNGSAVRVEKKMVQGSGTVLALEVTQKGHSANIEIPHVETMSDPALASEIESRLRAA
jgi:hypothetical protein